MVVAAGAAHRQPHEGSADGIGPVSYVLYPELFGDDAALRVLLVVAVEAGGQYLLGGGVVQQVAPQLPLDELVVGQVLVVRLDDPVAVGPHRVVKIIQVALRIREAGHVHPVGRHPLAVGGAGQ